LACGDQRRLTGNGSALEVVLHDYALYKSTFTLLTLYDLLSVCNCNYSSILYNFRDLVWKTRMVCLPNGEKV